MRLTLLLALLSFCRPAAAAQTQSRAAANAPQAVSPAILFGKTTGIGAPAPGLAPDLRLPHAGIALPGQPGNLILVPAAAAQTAAQAVSPEGSPRTAPSNASPAAALDAASADLKAASTRISVSLPVMASLANADAARLDSLYTGSRVRHESETTVGGERGKAATGLSKAAARNGVATALLAAAPPMLLPSGSPTWAESAAQALWPWAQAQPLLAALAAGFVLASALYSIAWIAGFFSKGKPGISVLGIIAAIASVGAVIVSGLSLAHPVAMLVAAVMFGAYFTGATKVTAALPAYFVPGFIGAALVHLGFLLGFPITTLFFLAGGLAMWSYTLNRQRASYWAKTAMGAILATGAILAFAFADRFVNTTLSQNVYLGAAWAGTMLVMWLFTALVSDRRKNP